MVTSYICEHSAEYSLVPYIKALLEREFEYVVPIFPWLSREFAGKSKMLHHNASFHILVVFPRRPKIAEDSKIYVTLNGELEAFKNVGWEHGINVIAGCPLATDFWELAKCNEFSWINISHTKTCEYLIEMSPKIDGKDGVLLTDKQLVDSVKNSRLQTMESFENFVREARYSQPSSFFGGRYKPIYFLTRAH